MKGDAPKTPREETEARVTALLLGELPPEQAATLEAEIAADPELKSLHARLREAIALVREASTIREQSAPATLARLSEERRERLLQCFKSEVRLTASPRKRRDWSSVWPLGLAAALIMLIGGALLLDSFAPRAGIPTGDRFVLFDTDESKQGTPVRSWWKERAPGPDEAGSISSPALGFPTSAPAMDMDVSGGADRGEGTATNPAWASAGQSSPSSSSASSSVLEEPLALWRLNTATERTRDLAATASPAPGLPAAQVPAPMSAAPPAPLIAGIESAPLARGGEESSARMKEPGNSALGAISLRPLNESKSDAKDIVTSKTDGLAEHSESAHLSLVPGEFATPRGEIAREQPADRAPDPTRSVELFAGIADTNALLSRADREKAQGVTNGAAFGFPSNAPAGAPGVANGPTVQEGAKASDWFGDFGGIAATPPVSGDARDALGRSSRSAGDAAAGGVADKRGGALEPSRLGDYAGNKVEAAREDAPRLGQLAKNFGNLNGRDPSDETARYYREGYLKKELEAVPEALAEKQIADLEKTDESRMSRARVGEVAKLAKAKTATKQVEQQLKEVDEAVVAPQRKLTPPVPQPEVSTRENRFSTFSLNVSDVSFKLAAASLENGTLPDPASIRSEEFINAFDYRDPEPLPGAPLAFATERARYPFAQNRDLVRIGIKSAAAGRQSGRALNVVLLVDNSGSMERADRVRILQEALRVLSGQLQPQDKLSIITFARTPRLWIDGVAGDKAGEATARISEITPQGGTNLSAALDLGYQTALRHYQVQSVNRVVLLTDGAANLGNVDAATLKEKVEAHRKQGVALDCFGIGWEGYNDDLLEVLSRNGDGRYGFINSVEEAATVFAAQLAGALRVAASDVKVQVEFNPRRVSSYRQVGYAKHQLTKEQFRDNTVDAAEIGAAEAGNGIYLVEVNPRGEGDLATVRVRFKVPGTTTYREQEWTVPFTPNAPPLEQASAALRLAGTASAFSEWLAGSPYAGEIKPDALIGLINGVPGAYGVDPRPKKLEWMIRQAKSLSGR